MAKINYRELQRELKRCMEEKNLNSNNDHIELSIECNEKFEQVKVNWLAIGPVSVVEANIFVYKLNLYIQLANSFNIKYEGYEIEY